MSEPLREAIAAAQSHEIAWPRDPHAPLAPGEVPWGVHPADPPPYNRLFGPVHLRGPQSGVVWQHGREIAAWGEPDRADLTFSVAKTMLALLAGVAERDGLLTNVDEPVVRRLPDIGFDSAHNRTVTWRHLLEQTSEWEGWCFGLPDTVDRWRKLAHDPAPAGGPKGGERPLRQPGTYWEYNDVRINQLSLALMHLFGRPLPEVFRAELLEPLGGGADMAWRGYDDAWTELPGFGRVQSVPGGSHWGGGLSISSRDLARLGQLVLDRGRCAERQLVPAVWIDRMAQPCAMASFYGWLVWLNRDRRPFPAASARALFMLGAGGHHVWVEPEQDAVVVLRWLDPQHAPRVIAALARALDKVR